MKLGSLSRWGAGLLAVVLVALSVNVLVAWACALWSPGAAIERDMARVERAARGYSPFDDQPDFDDQLGGFTAQAQGGVTVALHRGLGVDSVQFNSYLGFMRGQTVGPEPERWMFAAGLPLRCCEARPSCDIREAADAPDPWEWGFVPPTSWGATHVPVLMRGARPIRPIPYRPLTLPFVINTACYAAIIGIVWYLARSLRQLRRLKRGLCRRCAYDVGALPTCTECGTPTPLARSASRAPLDELRP